MTARRHHYNYVEDIVNTFLECVNGNIKSSKEILSEVFITILIDFSMVISSSFFLYSISKELFLILCIKFMKI